ncbi:MAG: SURF1 family protein [Minwuiales bacterium]|nr:SURF1 family protein [Minwuiales bacterium]
MSSFRPAFWPTVMTVPAVLAMIALGSWQVYRLDWKLNLIAQMEAQLAAAPVPLPAGALDPEAWDYRRVTVSGSFDHAKEVHMVSHSHRGNLGYHIYTPFYRDDGGGVVLVNRGWVPSDNKDPATRAEGQIAGPVVVDGIARKSWGQASFVPDNDPAQNVWFFPDLSAIAETMAIEPPTVFVAAGPAANPGGYPLGGQTKVTLRNNHLSYAITWYGLAVALVVIYILWHRSRRKRAAA